MFCFQQSPPIVSDVMSRNLSTANSPLNYQTPVSAGCTLSAGAHVALLREQSALPHSRAHAHMRAITICADKNSSLPSTHAHRASAVSHSGRLCARSAAAVITTLRILSWSLECNKYRKSYTPRAHAHAHTNQPDKCNKNRV